MKQILGMFKSTLATIANRWRVLAWILVAILMAILMVRALAFLLWRFGFPRVGYVGTAVLFVAGSISLILLLWLFPKWQVRSILALDSKERFDRENEARKTLSQIVGGLVLLIGFYFTWQNLIATQESQITDRFTKAITQLGDTKLELRLGGIYALERIAKDSPKDHGPIMEVLTAYVREHAKKIKTPAKPTPETSQQNNQSQFPEPAPDIQAILTVIGRRTLTYGKGEDRELDLSETDLSGANLFVANLAGAYLFDTKLIRAKLIGANLSWTMLTGADLSGANLGGANLSGAILREANLSGADLSGANLSEAFLVGANLSEADLTGAHLSGADLSTARDLSVRQLESAAEGNAQTKLPPNIPRPKFWPE